MSIRTRIPVPLWLFYGLVSLSGALGVGVISLLNQGLGHWNVVSAMLGEIMKAMLIGGTVGAFLRHVVPGQEEEKNSLGQHGIEALYGSRAEAGSKFVDAVKDVHTRDLLMVGISLRDCLHINGTLHYVWLAIRDRLQDEQRRQVAFSDRLKVRILLLDPTCPEGDFRFQVERKALPQGLIKDVPLGIQAVALLREELKLGAVAAHTAAPQPSILEARVYQHGSFAFELVTDSFAIVEQYMYRNRFGDSGMPLVVGAHVRT